MAEEPTEPGEAAREGDAVGDASPGRAGPAPTEEVAEVDDEVPSKARDWAALTHLAAFGFVVVPFFGQVLGPLVSWLVLRDEHPFVDAQGKEALNFQITWTLLFVLLAPLAFVGFAFGRVGPLIALPALALLGFLAVAWLVLVVVAAVKAGSGETWSYPLAIPFFSYP